MPRCNPWSLVAWMAVGCCLSTQFPLVASFLPNEGTFSTRRFLSSTPTAECETATTTAASQQPSSWLHKGLILSSFTDGLKTNPPAVDWLMNALVETLWKEEQGCTQEALQASNLASPCNGPDPFLLGQLEATDKVVEELTTKSRDWKAQLALLCDTHQARRLSDDGDQGSHIDLRVLYIPTAMYALRPSSTSKPGKQRGRNRADGKKRRNELMGLLERELADFWETYSNSDRGFTVRTVTLDWDDASVKQPEQVVVGLTETESKNDSSWVPESGKDAIRDWKPHLVYVQGGNTFWLHHCMEKGDWEQDLIDACGCFEDSKDSDNDDESSFSAVYCGVSAGAILAGESMQTACWKEWDDPSVVPGKETYKDWKDTKGLDASGKTSWFPHMTGEWQELTEEKTKTLLESTTASSSSSTVICVRDDQAFGIDGKTQSITELR